MVVGFTAMPESGKGVVRQSNISVRSELTTPQSANADSSPDKGSHEKCAVKLGLPPSDEEVGFATAKLGGREIYRAARSGRAKL